MVERLGNHEIFYGMFKKLEMERTRDSIPMGVKKSVKFQKRKTKE
jgi:hypothetical protein